jgi:hypothetical protein
MGSAGTGAAAFLAWIAAAIVACDPPPAQPPSAQAVDPCILQASDEAPKDAPVTPPPDARVGLEILAPPSSASRPAADERAPMAALDVAWRSMPDDALTLDDDIQPAWSEHRARFARRRDALRARALASERGPRCHDAAERQQKIASLLRIDLARSRARLLDDLRTRVGAPEATSDAWLALATLEEEAADDAQDGGPFLARAKHAYARAAKLDQTPFAPFWPLYGLARTALATHDDATARRALERIAASLSIDEVDRVEARLRLGDIARSREECASASGLYRTAADAAAQERAPFARVLRTLATYRTAESEACARRFRGAIDAAARVFDLPGDPAVVRQSAAIVAFALPRLDPHDAAALPPVPRPVFELVAHLVADDAERRGDLAARDHAKNALRVFAAAP